MDSAEMYMQALEKKAQKRKFQKFHYAFVYKVACNNSKQAGRLTAKTG